MILKKPYAFLIKHFRMIHSILCLLFLYLLIKYGNIAGFFSGYIAANYSTYETNIASHYINIWMYIDIIILLLTIVAIFSLMKQKEKSTKFYFSVLIFYIALFVFTFFIYGVMFGMEEVALTAKSARLYRDFSYMAYLPQYFFLGYSALRAIGFDIKSFNFDLDMQELEISDTDDQEFEINIGKDAYLYKRSIRRFFRELSYYIKEYQMVIVGFLAIVLLIIGGATYMIFGVYHRSYGQQQIISHNGLTVQVEDSELSMYDLGGRKIDGNYYLAVSLKVKNQSIKSERLDYENFKIKLGKDYIIPTLDRGSYFLDLGIPYTRDTLVKPGEETIFVLTYQIPQEFLRNDLKLQILESIQSSVTGLTSLYKEIKLDYDIVKEKKEVLTQKMGKILELSDSRLGYTKLHVQSYAISSTASYNYQKCSNGNCQDLKGEVTVDPVKYGIGKKILTINNVFTLDTGTKYFLARKGAGNFVKDFVRIRYNYNNTTKEASIINLTPSIAKNVWFLLIPQEVENAQKLDLIIEIRGKLYIVNLK